MAKLAFDPFTPKSDQCQISPSASPEIRGYSPLIQMKDDDTTNSGTFELGSERVENESLACSGGHLG